MGWQQGLADDFENLGSNSERCLFHDDLEKNLILEWLINCNLSSWEICLIWSAPMFTRKLIQQLIQITLDRGNAVGNLPQPCL